MAIHSQPISAYVESEIPEGMTLSAYRFRNVNRDREERRSLRSRLHSPNCLCRRCQLEVRARYGGRI